MHVVDYLSGRVDHQGRALGVPDLVLGSDVAPQLILVFESPGKHELEVGLPVVGPTGIRALEFLMPGGLPPQSLGRFVKNRHECNDGRVAIMNVSNVPLQRESLEPITPTGLGDGVNRDSWDLLRSARRHWGGRSAQSQFAAVNELTTLLRGQFQRRVAVIDPEASALVVPWGAVARRFCAGLRTVFAGDVPHPSPSNPRWNSWVIANNGTATMLRMRFAQSTAVGASIDDRSDLSSGDVVRE